MITTTSEARAMHDALTRNGTQPGFPVIGLAGPITVSHQNYAMAIYRDKSILIWSRNDGYLILEDNQTYYRDTVEHLARCLGTFPKERRAQMVGGQDKWIDGIHWAADGSFLGV
jgi:methionine synthase I (cobalamin-dependent)